ncbi:MAG: GTP cyclohydrolase FolE2 [Planctomycetota bacterium]
MSDVIVPGPAADDLFPTDPQTGRPVLPDVAADSVAAVPGTIDRVGMSGVDLMISLPSDDGEPLRLPARADAQVSLDDPDAKGIHMSRLFLTLDNFAATTDLTPSTAGSLVESFVDSHHPLSAGGFLRMTFDYPLRRESLLSGLSGWRLYPVKLETRLDGAEVTHRLSMRISYSSTCPCSAALSRQLMQAKFVQTFGDSGSVDAADIAAWLNTPDAAGGLPHAQRSHADVTVTLAGCDDEYPIGDLIGRLEDAVGTPVQTAVKRADEQEFARLNAERLMFCEDAARIFAAELDTVDFVSDYRVEIEHLESLHPHDAVATITKGVPGGLTA